MPPKAKATAKVSKGPGRGAKTPDADESIPPSQPRGMADTFVDQDSDQDSNVGGGHGASQSSDPAAGMALVAVPKGYRGSKPDEQKLDIPAAKRFKSHAKWHAENNLDPEVQMFASRALQLYSEGDHDTKQKILNSLAKDKTYKFVNNFEEVIQETEADKNQMVGGWMTKWDYAAYLKVPTTDQAVFDTVMAAAVEGMDSKPHDNAGLARVGVLLYNVPKFKVGGDVVDTVSAHTKNFRSETSITPAALEQKAGLKPDNVKVKMEYPLWVKLMSRVKVIEQGQKILAKTINASRAASAKFKVFERNTSAHGLAEHFKRHEEGFQSAVDMEMDVMSLVAECKSVGKECLEDIKNLLVKVEATITNGSTAVSSLEQLRKATLAMLA